MTSLLSFSVSRSVLVLAMAGSVLGGALTANAADPLVLSNDGSVSTPRSGLYWDIQQSDGIVALLGDKPIVQCTATKHIAPRLQLKITGGNYAVTQVEAMSERLTLPHAKTVPVILSFNRGAGDVRATAAVLSSSRLVIAMPDPKLAYDYFGQSTALRIAVDLGEDVRTAMYDLTGLRTALSDLETCVVTPAATPVPDGIKHAMPPPVPVRTPAALLDAELERGMNAEQKKTLRSDERPEVTAGVRGIPALAWPELDPPVLRIRSVPSVPSASSTPSVPLISLPPSSVPSVPAPLAVASPPPLSVGPVIVGDVYSPARARAQQQESGQFISGSSSGSSVVVAPVPVTQAPRNQVIISAPALAIPTAPSSMSSSEAASIVWRHGTARYDVRTVETYRARAGEHLRDVLRRWADRGGIDLVWNMPGDVILDKDFSYVGGFKDALKGLIAFYPQSGINTRFMDDGVPFERQPFVDETRAPSAPVAALPGPALDDFTPSTRVSNITPPPAQRPILIETSVSSPSLSSPDPHSQQLQIRSAEQSAVPVIPRRAMTSPVYDEQPRVLPSLAAPRDVAAPALPASPLVAIGPVKRWRALSGASMRQVIQAWAEEAQVNVIWLSPRDYAVRYSVNGSTDFGRAVADLMAQYARDPARPQGQLFNDPKGDRTLVVR